MPTIESISVEHIHRGTSTKHQFMFVSSMPFTSCIITSPHRRKNKQDHNPRARRLGGFCDMREWVTFFYNQHRQQIAHITYRVDLEHARGRVESITYRQPPSVTTATLLPFSQYPCLVSQLNTFSYSKKVETRPKYAYCNSK